MMKLSNILLCASLAVALFKPAISTESQPLINEFMASNTSTIYDEDRVYPDWIEIYNPGDSPVDLTGYGLSDRPDNPFKWVFPEVILEPKQYFIVFASGKDRTKLPSHWETVINHGDEWRYFIGTSEPPENWHSIGFDDSGWQSGPSGIGSRAEDATIIPKSNSFYIRKPFYINDIANITRCLLQIDYQDAFVAYINGHEIARSNIGEAGISPSYDENAIEFRNMEIYSGGNPEVYNIEDFSEFIITGENVLAIQVHSRVQVSSFFYKYISVIPFLTLEMTVPPSEPKGVPEILNFSIPVPPNLHTNFKINSDGETLVFTDPDGVICDSVYTRVDGTDISIGRNPDGGEEWVLSHQPTPGESNITEGYQGYADALVEMSLPGGFYDSGILVELSTNTPTAEIRYTLDGSEPSKISTLYTTAVSIDVTTVLRARVFKEGLFPGSINTKTYFINQTSTLPIISLSTDPKNLWDEDIGIYLDNNCFEDWERPIHMEFFEPDGIQVFSIDAGVKISGLVTRSFTQKPLSIFVRPKYGQSNIDYKIFPDLPITEFKSVTFRNGGNEDPLTRFKDALCHSIVKNINLDIMAYRPAVVFINGKYWGIYNIREKQNEDYLASHHGVDPNNIDMLEYVYIPCLLYTSPSPRDGLLSRMPSSA